MPCGSSSSRGYRADPGGQLRQLLNVCLGFDYPAFSAGDLTDPGGPEIQEGLAEWGGNGAPRGGN
jgi:hypothetical protein